MKLKFKVQPYQTHAVESLADCFAGQPKSSGVSYRIDPGAVLVKPVAPIIPRQTPLAGMEPASPTEASDAGFVNALQKDISESPSARPRVADEKYFAGKVRRTTSGDVEVSPQIAKQIYRYLAKNDYTDDNKAAYTVHFESAELVGKCVAELDKELRVKPMQYVIERGVQEVNPSFEDLKAGTSDQVKYDVVDSYGKSMELVK